jgi:guanylate kinase
MEEPQRGTSTDGKGHVAGSNRRLVVLSAPSGAGKTTLAHRLLDRNPEWRFSVSATTRPRRPGETDGVDYHFLTIEEFRERIAANDLVEWEEIFGNYYGTLKSTVEELLDEKSDRRVIFDVDVKGALAIRNAFPNDAFLIFIAPPSMEELLRRLMGRKTESEESIRRRIDRAKMEMAMQPEFDATVVNDEIERATDELERLLGQ